jgi:hypothetical protein
MSVNILKAELAKSITCRTFGFSSERFPGYFLGGVHAEQIALHTVHKEVEISG